MLGQRATSWSQPNPGGDLIIIRYARQHGTKPMRDWRRADNLYGFDGRLQSLLGGVEAAHRSERI